MDVTSVNGEQTCTSSDQHRNFTIDGEPLQRIQSRYVPGFLKVGLTLYAVVGSSVEYVDSGTSDVRLKIDATHNSSAAPSP